MNLPYLHLLLNHWPILGAFIGLALFAVALVTRNSEMRQASFVLFVLVALMGIPVYLSGNAAAEALKKTPEIPMQRIDAHEGAALLAFASLEITGIFALIGLWRFSRGTQDSTHAAPWASTAVLIFAVVTGGLMAVAGNTGGDIRHSEILAEGEAAPSIATMGAQMILQIRYFVIDYSRWVWPVIETLHFVGLILLVGAVGILSVRILGFLKPLPVNAVHRLIPLGLAGLIINVITGFLFFIGMPFFYVFNWFFQIKILTIVVAGAILLLCYCSSAFRKWGSTGPGEDAPVFAKLVAWSTIVLWLAVIVIGRYIPLGEVTQ